LNNSLIKRWCWVGKDDPKTKSARGGSPASFSSMETGLVDTAYPDDHFSFLFRPFDAVSYLPQLGNISAGNKLRINT